MTEPAKDVLPRDICSYCDALVYPGQNCLIRCTHGEPEPTNYDHMKCYMIACDKKRAEEKLHVDRKFLIASDTASAEIAKAVKMADIRHNLSDLTHPKEHVQRRDKYQLALKLLEV